jgi:quinol monooxygenase YgiN
MTTDWRARDPCRRRWVGRHGDRPDDDSGRVAWRGKGGSVIVLTVKYTCKAGQAEAVLTALGRMAPLVRAHEAGCKAYQISRSVEQPDLLFLYEIYEDQAAFDAHVQTAHFKEIIQGEVIQMLETRVRETFELAIG